MPYAPVTNGQIPLTGWTYTHEARGQEDQLPGVEQKSGRPDPVALSSTEPALGQSTRERDTIDGYLPQNRSMTGSYNAHHTP